MARTEEAQWWFDAVYNAVLQVPPGKVTTYGHIALLLGRPERPRQVGVCLKHLPSRSDEVTHHFHMDNVPWQRVINSKGQISPRGPNGATRQAQALRREHVRVERNAMGELRVDMAKYGWFPAVLPSEAGSGQEESGDEVEGDEGEAEVKEEEEEEEETSDF